LTRENMIAPKGKTCCVIGMARMSERAGYGGATIGIVTHSAR
jgi:hypothetical protein